MTRLECDGFLITLRGDAKTWKVYYKYCDEGACKEI